MSLNLQVGGSVFYSEEPNVEKAALTEVETLDKELDAGREAALLETKLSSLVWICTSTHMASIVTVIDANNPAEILNSFGVCANHLMCIASVPGASPSDYDNDNVTKSKNSETTRDSDDLNLDNNKENSAVDNSDNVNKEEEVEVDPDSLIGKIIYVEKDDSVVNKRDRYTKANDTEHDPTPNNSSSFSSEITVESAEGEENTKNNAEEEKRSTESNEHEVMSSVLATMWLGAQSGMLYVHSSVASWNQCLHSVKLRDAVLSIV